MLKKISLLVFAVAVMMMQSVACASPEPQYCSSDGEYDYYVVDVHRPHNPGLLYVTVRRSDDVEYWYAFSENPPQRTYSYHYTYVGHVRNILGNGLITENQLANDIFYVARHWPRREECEEPVSA